MALEPGTLAEQDDGRGYREIQPGGLTGSDGRDYAKRQMVGQQQRMVRSDPGQLAGAQVSGTLAPIDAPTSVKLADVAERHADLFNADDLSVINASVVELQAYEILLATPPANAPVNVDVPYLSQTADVLSCTMGNWEGEPKSYSYQWNFDGNDVGADVGAGAGGDPATYSVTTVDAGKVVICTVTATNDYGSTIAPPSNEVTVTDPGATQQAAREA